MSSPTGLSLLALENERRARDFHKVAVTTEPREPWVMPGLAPVLRLLRALRGHPDAAAVPEPATR